MVLVCLYFLDQELDQGDNEVGVLGVLLRINHHPASSGHLVCVGLNGIAQHLLEGVVELPWINGVQHEDDEPKNLNVCLEHLGGVQRKALAIVGDLLYLLVLKLDQDFDKHVPLEKEGL